MKGKAFLPLGLGLVIGIIAVKFVVDAVKNAKGSTRNQQMVMAVRAKQDIPQTSQITTEMVELVETTDNVFASTMERMSKMEDVLDRVAAKSIAAGSPVLKSMLADKGTKPGVVSLIREGFVAQAVKIDEVSGAGFHIKAGDTVDALVAMNVDSGDRGRKQSQAKMLVGKVQLAAIGTLTSGQAADAAAKVKPAKSALLLIPEKYKEIVHWANTYGKVSLVLRGYDENSEGQGPDPEVLKLYEEAAFGKEQFADAKRAPRPVTTIQPLGNIFQEPEDEPFGVLVFHGVTQEGKAGRFERVTFASPQSSEIVEVVTGLPTRSMDRAMMRPQHNVPQTEQPPANPSSSQPKSSPSDKDATDDNSNPEDEDIDSEE